jgi:hypothetical protein
MPNFPPPDTGLHADCDCQASAEGLLIGTLTLMSAWPERRCARMALKICSNLRVLSLHPAFSHEFQVLCGRLFSNWRADLPDEVAEFVRADGGVTNLTRH